MKINLSLTTAEFQSYRAARVKGLFNCDDPSFSLTANLPLEERPWQIGVIVGPSGSGKTSLGRALFGPFWGQAWPEDRPVIDAVAPGALFDRVTSALTAAGLGSVPSWLRPYPVLSNGEKFRAEMARLLAEAPAFAMVDEYTSLLDRQTAAIGSMAFAKAWRRQAGQIVLLTCHDDVLAWLEPDWVFRTDTAAFHWGERRQRPSLTFDLRATDSRAWPRFEPHHYLKLSNVIAGSYYVAECNGQAVAHIAVTTTPGLRYARACRLVVLPEWQGIGLGWRLLTAVADLWRQGENRYALKLATIFHTSHPGLAASLRRAPGWVQTTSFLHGDNKAKSIASINGAIARGRFKGDRKTKTGYGGHFRPIQGFRYDAC